MKRFLKMISTVCVLAMLTGCTQGAVQPTVTPVSATPTEAVVTLTEAPATATPTDFPTPTDVPTPTEAPTPTVVTTPTDIPTPTATVTPYPTNTPVPVIDRTAAFELLSKLNVGWNLGNTLDSHGRSGVAAETYWGNPKTTQAMIDAIAEQGFNTIRIPVTFANHVGKAPDYTIDEAWLARVKEVVDYAYNNDMYVILDTHHEPDYWLVPDKSKLETVSAELCAIWKQLSEYFMEYDEHLIFEGMNEPRTKGSAGEWNGGTDSERGAVNLLNKAFVETVRATGGNNERRLLIICPYGNSVVNTSFRTFMIPEDEMVAVAVHMYTPYNFTFEPDTSVFNWNLTMKSEIRSQLLTVKSYFLDKGLPVIITEFGAVHKTNAAGDNTQEVLEWLEDYMGLTNEYGIKCVWWDNGVYSGNGERFGIFNRRTLTFFNQQIADKLVEMGNRGMVE